MHTYARIHTRVELKLAAWEEDKARGCVNSLLVSVAKKDLSFEQNGEKGRERKRERERERDKDAYFTGHQQFSWANMPVVCFRGRDSTRERERARVSNEAVCANLCASSAPCVSKFRSRHPLSPSLATAVRRSRLTFQNLHPCLRG